MSLSCDETGKTIMGGDTFYAGTRDDVRWYKALSASVIDSIPTSKRSSTPRKKGELGADIHKASGEGGGFTGAVQNGAWSLDEFLFSIDTDTVNEFLPRSYRAYT